MRARNLKPSLFTNDLLAVSDPVHTVIFAGLWCLADREGRLEDRPARIHLAINPGRDFGITDRALAWLAENGFIARYEAGGIRCIQVVNFAKHQNPHVKEAPSKLPKQGASTVQAPDSASVHESEAPGRPENSTGPARLIPDSGFLIPDSSPSGREAPAGAAPTPPRPKTASRLPEDFTLTAERRAVAAAEGLDPERTFAAFCDYWRAAAGQNSRKLDWDATWRTWCRREADRLPRSGGTQGRVPLVDSGSQRVPTEAQRAESERKALEAAARAYGIDPAGLSEAEINNRIYAKKFGSEPPRRATA